MPNHGTRSVPTTDMRWFWIDRFTEFERGRKAVAIKSVALSEEALDGYNPAFRSCPAR